MIHPWQLDFIAGTRVRKLYYCIVLLIKLFSSNSNKSVVNHWTSFFLLTGDFDDFCVRALELIDQSNGAPLFTIAETRSSPRPASNHSALRDNGNETTDCDPVHGLPTGESENSAQEDDWQLL